MAFGCDQRRGDGDRRRGTALSGVGALDNVTIFHAGLRVTSDGASPYCYAKGLIAGRITYHVQPPLPERWNGRFIHLGDGGADGDLDYADTFVARGYAVANSNTGHDVGAAGDAYGYADDVAAADFAWRAVHLTTNAGKAVVANYYTKAQEYAYHVGCSTGGRQDRLQRRFSR